jgi:type I site-specific restriction endonuclease
MFRITASALLFGVVALAQAQPTTSSGIYTCVDAQGRKLTSDRPIAECSDREQKVLNPSGTLKAKVGPTLTAQERIQLEAREKAELEEQARLNEEKRRDRALLTRYPNKTVHDGERAEAVAQIGVVRQASVNRVEELQRQRTVVMDELEFYKKDPNKAPPSLRRQMDDVTHSLSVQSRFIADQDAEIKRVNARFDEELLRLKQLWAQQAAPAAAKKR